MRTLILLIFLGLSSHANAFESTHLRFISGTDLIRTLKSTLPYAETGGYDDYRFKCRNLEGSLPQILGMNNPESGKGISAKPGPLYLQWWGNCVKLMATGQQAKLKQFSVEDPRLIEIRPDEMKNRWGTEIQNIDWKKNAETDRLILIQHWIKRLGGVGIYKDIAGLAKKIDQELSAERNANRSIFDAYQSVVIRVMTDEKFLSY